MIIVDAVQGSAEWHRLRCGVVTASDAAKIVQPGAASRPPRWFALTDAGLVARLRGSVQMAVQATLAAPFSASGAAFRPGGMSIDERQIPGGISGTLFTMIERGYVVEVDPPPDAEPVQAPLRVSSQRDGYLSRLLAEELLQRPVDPFMGNYWTERGHEGEGPAAETFELITGMRPQAVGFIFRDETRTVGCSPDWGIFGVEGLLATVEVKNFAEDRHVAVLLSGEMPRENVPQVQFQTWVTGCPAWFLSACPPEADGVVRLPPLIERVDPDPRWHAAFDEHVPALVEELVEKRARLLELGAVPAGVAEEAKGMIIADMTDAELDAAVATEVMGWEVGPQPGGSRLRVWPEAPRIRHTPLDDWSPSTDIAAAFEVVERMLEAHKLDISIDRAFNTNWRADFTNEPTQAKLAVYASARASTLPRAICEAALKAVRS